MEDLEGIKTLESQLKAYRYPAELFYMQGEPLREEAAALGVGKLDGLLHSSVFSGMQFLLPSALASLRDRLRWVAQHH